MPTAFAKNLIVDLHGGPYRSVQAALNVAGPGDTVHVKPGVYQERIEFKNGGTSGNPVILEGEPGAIIDGSDPVTLNWQAATDVGAGVYRASVDFMPWTISVDGKLITTLDERKVSPDSKLPVHNNWVPQTWPDIFVNGVGPSKWDGVVGVAMYQSREKSLLVRLKNGVDPRQCAITVARKRPCINVRGRDFCTIRSITTRYASYGISIQNSYGSVIEGCRIGSVDFGIDLNENADHCVVRYNDISYDPYCGADCKRNGEWDAWQACKTDGFSDRIGIKLYCTKGGHDIHDNYVHDEWDGIDTSDISYEGRPHHVGNAQTNQNVLIHHNYLNNIFDDAIETAGPLANGQYYQNIFRNSRCGFRIKGPTLGPIFSYKNIFIDNIEDYRNFGERSQFSPSDPAESQAEVWVYQNTSTSRCAINMNYSKGDNSIITAPNYHYYNNLFWCQTWVGRARSFPLPDWHGDYNVYVKAGRAAHYPWPVDKLIYTMSNDLSQSSLDKQWAAGIELARAAGLDRNSTWIDDASPGFVNPAAGNFALREESVARSKGFDLSQMRTRSGNALPGCERRYFRGDRPDVGALQYGEPMLKIPR
jgi:hypothetical protein